MNNDNTKQNGKFIIALSRALQHIHRKSEQLFHQNGLTMAQFAVLEALQHKGDLTIKEIIEAVLSSSGNITVVVRNLEQRGLVLRRVNPADKRSFFICITPAGAELLLPVYAQHMALVEEALLPLEPAEKAQVITILKKLQGGTRHAVHRQPPNGEK